MNQKIVEWMKRYEKVNVFQEFEEIIEILKMEYLKDDGMPWIISYSGGKDSSLVLTLVWQAITQIPKEYRKRLIHIVMSDTAVETPVMENYQFWQLHKINQSIKEQGLCSVFKTHMVRPPVTSRFFYKVIGRGTPPPSPNARNRFCTYHLKIAPIQKKIDEIIQSTTQTNHHTLFNQNNHVVVSLLGVRLDESKSRANSIRKFEVDDLYAEHATDKRIKVMHPIKHIDLDSLWAYLESLPHGEFPYGGSVKEMMKQYGKTGFECGLKDGSEGEGQSCGAAGSRSGCWLCPLVSGEDKMLKGLIDEGYRDYIHLQEWKQYMISIRNDIRFRLPTQRQKFNLHAKIAKKEQETTHSLFSHEFLNDMHENRRHLYETFGRATFNYAPGAFTIEARKRLLEYLLWIEKQINVELIEEDELNAIFQTWKEDGYTIDRSDIIPTKHIHQERLILYKDGTINEKETNVTSFPIFYVKIRTRMSESEFITHVQKKVRETNQSIPYLSQVLDFEKQELVFNEFIFVVCTAYASNQREAEHYVYSWLGWKRTFDYENYDPPYEGWSPEDEGIYFPKRLIDQLALSDHLIADKIIDKIYDKTDLATLWKYADTLYQVDNYIEKLKLFEILKRINSIHYLSIDIPSKLLYQIEDSGQLTLSI